MGPSRVRRIVLALVVASAPIAACVVADPPTTLPQIPERRPTILHASVFPPSGSIISTWPPDSTFIVPVELSSSRSPVGYAVFIDYNPLTPGQGLDGVAVNLDPDQTQEGLIRKLEIPITRPPLDGCHRIEVVVGLRILAELPHSPPDPGGDIVHWIFNPAGDLAGCPTVDAGLSPLSPDGSADAATDADAELP
jgi:hypothetical protein